MVPCFPILGLTPSGLFMGLSSTLIYTSELILCSQCYAAQHSYDSEILDYKRLKDELLVYSGVVLRGNRIVVPSKLRERAVELAHVGHQSIVKKKSLIREKVWFPGIDKIVKDKVDNCL